MMVEDKKTFEKRVAKVDPDFKPSAWRKFRNRPRRKIRVPMAATSLALVLCYGTLTTTKVIMENELGPQGFDAKVSRLAQGDDTSRIAAKLLWRDPVMEYVQEKLL